MDIILRKGINKLEVARGRLEVLMNIYSIAILYRLVIWINFYLDFIEIIDES